ncbi:MAG: hypothetical protein H6Q77_1955 [Gemmatimonadetes bacterium]|nr:hypothetical protein [Gemmatimonadota bacterium]
MERSVLQHLTPDEIDLVLEGNYPEVLRTHVNACPDCGSLLAGERLVVQWLSALPLHVPAAGFEDRVMARVQVVTPRSALATLRHRALATPTSRALAAGAVLSVLGSLTASIVWSLGHREVLASLGMTALRSVAELGWVVVHGLATTLVEQPWYGSARALVDSPARLAFVAGGLTTAWAAGMLLMRRLIAIPAGSVAHEHI